MWFHLTQKTYYRQNITAEQSSALVNNIKIAKILQKRGKKRGQGIIINSQILIMLLLNNPAELSIKWIYFK